MANRGIGEKKGHSKPETGSFTNGSFLLIQFQIDGLWKGQLVSKLLKTSCCIFPREPM